MLKKGFTLLAQIVFSRKYLFYVNVGASLTLSGVGDMLEQQYEIISKDLQAWDRTRTKNMALAGCTSGFICHFWYNYLEYKIPGNSIMAVGKKVLADQIICSPITISLFFITLALLESKNFHVFKEELKTKAVHLYLAEWLVWPSAQFINFYVLPLRYRVLYDNTISLGYDIYASYIVKRNPNKIKAENIDKK